MAAMPGGELSLATLRPKSHLMLRLLFQGTWKVLAILGIVFALVGVGTAFLAGHMISQEKRYEREGKTVVATVTRKDTYTTTSSGGRRRRTRTTHYRVYYTFADAEGSTHDGKGNVPHSLWRKLQPGDPVEVQYLPGSPEKNRPAAASQGKTVWLFLLFPVAFGGAGLAILGILARRAAKHSALLAHGILTKGTVEAKRLRTNITIYGRHPHSIRYRFALADGGEQTGEDLVMDQGFAAKCTEGEPVGVIYLPADPSRCTLFRDKWMRYFEMGGP